MALQFPKSDKILLVGKFQQKGHGKMFDKKFNKALLSELNELRENGYYPEWCIVNRTENTRCYTDDYDVTRAYLSDHDGDDCAVLSLTFAA